MNKYRVRLQTNDMEEKGKSVIVKLPGNELPTPYNIISQRLTDYYTKNKEELGFKTSMDIARAVAHDTHEMINNLVYYEIKEIKE